MVSVILDSSYHTNSLVNNGSSPVRGLLTIREAVHWQHNRQRNIWTEKLKSQPWEQQLAVPHCEQAGALCWAWTPPLQAHQACRGDSRTQSWSARERHPYRRLSRGTLYLETDSQSRTGTHKLYNIPRSLSPALSLLGLMASRGTCTLLREMSVALAGLPWKGGLQGDRERNSGLPGAEPRLWTLAWDRAGEPGMVPWRR